MFGAQGPHVPLYTPRAATRARTFGVAMVNVARIKIPLLTRNVQQRAGEAEQAANSTTETEHKIDNTKMLAR